MPANSVHIFASRGIDGIRIMIITAKIPANTFTINEIKAYLLGSLGELPNLSAISEKSFLT